MTLAGLVDRGGRIWRLSQLAVVAAVEMGTPLVRMIVLARFLDLAGVGFSAAVSAVYATILQVTDIAINRFVFSTPREDYRQAIAAAHGLSLLRGGGAALLALAAAPLAARYVTGGEHVATFLCLAPIFLGRAFEHLEPRVAERDYRYGSQLKVNLIASGCALAALALIAGVWRSPQAIVGFLIAQNVAQVLASHAYATTRYEFRLTGPYFAKAWRFAYPLMFNGAGLALTQQGDRLMIASVLGLPALGLYSTAIMVAWVPISFLFRLMNTLNMATLFNAPDGERYRARLRFFASATPLIAAAYALCVLAFMNWGIALVFGQKFVMSPALTASIGVFAFLSIVRTEPFTTLLLHEMRTGQLATINLLTSFGLAASALLALHFRTLAPTVIGRALGEAACLGVAVYLTRDIFRPALANFGLSLALSFGLTAIAVLLHFGLYSAPVSHTAALTGLLGLVGAGAVLLLRDLFQSGYRSRTGGLSRKGEIEGEV